MNVSDWELEILAKAGHLSACITLLEASDDPHLIMTEHMSVTAWTDGGGMDPDESSKVPDEFEFSEPWWQAIWEYLPTAINDKIVEYFEEQGP